MRELKPISPDAVPAAMKKAERYRLLNQPVEAESICRDILAAEPGHREAQVTLVLALTDQLARHERGLFAAAREAVGQLPEGFEREYYSGILFERWGKAQFRRRAPGSGALAHDWLSQAMSCFERAQELAPPGNDDAVLRWNACVRFMDRHREIAPPQQEAWSQPFLE
jgi:hypothetical protein